MDNQEFEFNLAHAKGLIRQVIVNNKIEEDVKDCIEYCGRFFFPCKNDTHLLMEGDEITIYPSSIILKKDYMDRLGKAVRKWYFEDIDIVYTVITDPRKPRFGRNRINISPGMKFQEENVKPFEEYSESAKRGAKAFLDFMREVLAYNRDDVYDYLVKWVANVCKGQKNDSLLYLKSTEGTGKSFFAETLMEYVIGTKISYTSPAEPLLTSYNRPLMGKLLVVFEELPTFSLSQWAAVASKIKRSVTGKTETYSDKYLRGFEAQNLNNYIINTNVDALMTSEGRRIFHVDVNTIHERDYAYFGELSRLVQNNEAGEALFAYFVSIDTSNFGGQKDMPETRGQRNAIVARLDTVHEFLKQNYILKKNSINKKDVAELYEEYTTFMIGKDKRPYSKFDFTSKMREIQCDYYKSNGKNKYDVSYDKLKAIADKKKWIHELDEVEDNKIKIDEDKFGVEKKKTLPNIFPKLKPKYEVVKIPEVLEYELKKGKELTKQCEELLQTFDKVFADINMKIQMVNTEYASVGSDMMITEKIELEDDDEFDYEDAEMSLDLDIQAFFK